MNAITATLTANGQVKVERIICNIVSDRYIVPTVKQAPKTNAAWVKDAVSLLSQDTAGIVIQVPPTPSVKMSSLDRAHETIIVMVKEMIEMKNHHCGESCPECAVDRVLEISDEASS